MLNSFDVYFSVFIFLCKRYIHYRNIKYGKTNRQKEIKHVFF